MNTDVLRPTTPDEFIGQEKLIQHLLTRAQAARDERRPMPHVYLAASAGYGKTSLASLVAEMLDDPFDCLVMPVTERVLEAYVRQFDGVLLLDELHRCSERQQEVLLPLLEFGYLQGRTGRRVEAGWLTIIGATTERDDIIEPLLDRFPIKPVFDEYTNEHLTQIVLGMAAKAGLEIDEDQAQILGAASGGTPRNARSLVLAGKDLQVTLGRTPTAEEILTLCEVDDDGLDKLHITYLHTLDELGSVAGESRLASALRLNPRTVREIERLLRRKGMIAYGPTGRELTSLGYRKIKEGKVRAA